jgi:hypothetical protein
MTFVKQFAGASGEVDQIPVLFRLGRHAHGGGTGGRRCECEGRRCSDSGAGGNNRPQEGARRLVVSGKVRAFARTVALGIRFSYGGKAGSIAYSIIYSLNSSIMSSIIWGIS